MTDWWYPTLVVVAGLDSQGPTDVADTAADDDDDDDDDDDLLRSFSDDVIAVAKPEHSHHTCIHIYFAQKMTREIKALKENKYVARRTRFRL